MRDNVSGIVRISLTPDMWIELTETLVKIADYKLTDNGSTFIRAVVADEMGVALSVGSELQRACLHTFRKFVYNFIPQELEEDDKDDKDDTRTKGRVAYPGLNED